MNKRSELDVDERSRKKSNPGPRPDPSHFSVPHPSIVSTSVVPMLHDLNTVEPTAQLQSTTSPESFFGNFINHDFPKSSQRVSFFNFSANPVDSFASSTTPLSNPNSDASFDFPALTNASQQEKNASDFFLSKNLSFSMQPSFQFLPLSNLSSSNSNMNSTITIDEPSNRTIIQGDLNLSSTAPAFEPSHLATLSMSEPLETLPMSTQIHPSEADSVSSDDTSLSTDCSPVDKPCFQLIDDFALDNLISSNITASGSKRRSRASPEQLHVLEKTFILNRSPNAKIREELSKKLGMTERSIQIWFQNKRAKVKLRQRQSFSEESPLPPASAKNTEIFQVPTFSPLPPFGQTNFNEALKLNAAGLGASDFQLFSGISTSANTSSLPSLDILGTYMLPLEFLTIGTWRRVAYGPDSVACSYSLVNRMFSWTVTDKENVFKMEIPFTCIRQLLFRLSDDNGELHLLLNQPPSFWMQVDSGNGAKYWSQCLDFTENNQAETTFSHTLRGRALPLQTHLAAILQADSSLREISSIEESSSTLVPSLSSMPSSPPRPIGIPPNPSHPVQKLKSRPRRSASAPLLPNFRLQQMSTLQLQKLSAHQKQQEQQLLQQAHLPNLSPMTLSPSNPLQYLPTNLHPSLPAFSSTTEGLVMPTPDASSYTSVTSQPLSLSPSHFSKLSNMINPSTVAFPGLTVSTSSFVPKPTSMLFHPEMTQ